MGSPKDPVEDDFIPRNYQDKLMEVALKQNTIIFLPTGSGKTFIAVMVLKRLGQALEKSYSEGGKLSIMTVNTVALVDQHSKYLRRHTHFRIGAYTGDMNVDSWDRDVWAEEFNKNQVLVMTAQILVNILHSNFINLSRINFLVFDECHHGVSDQPMRHLMRLFQYEQDPPRVLGLTGSLLNKNIKINKLQEELETLETTYHSKIAAAEEMEEVIGYSTNPVEHITTYESHTISIIESSAIEVLSSVIEVLEALQVNKSTVQASKKLLQRKPNISPLDPERNCKDWINCIKDAILHIEMLGIYGGMIVAISYSILFECQKKHCQDIKLYNILNAIVSAFTRVKCLFEKHMETVPLCDRIKTFSSAKVKAFINAIKNYPDQCTQELCGIVFVKRRFTAKILFHILDDLKKQDDSMSFIKPNFVVGFSNNAICDTREGPFKTKMNRKVLNSFSMKEYNLLIATNVIEEGVDIPRCTCIIKFDEPQDYRSYVQSKGRARHRNSHYYIMVESVNYQKFYSKYTQFRVIECALSEYLVGKNEKREVPSDDKIQEMYDEHLFPPFYVDGPGSAHVDMLTAIPLLAMYCNSLPSDIFTVYNPGWFVDTKKEKENNQFVSLYKVFIELPIICPILEPIEGIFVRNKKIAKRVAALRACIALYEAGELTSDLTPVKRSVPDPSTDFLFSHWPSEKEKFAGINKMTRYYTKKIPDTIKGAIPINQVVYLHLINLSPTFSNSNMNQSAAYDLISSDLCFALITIRPLTQICEFPLYLSAGEINVTIQENFTTLKLTEKEMSQLRAFHNVVFEDILRLVKPFMYLHREDDEEMVLTVPIRKGNGKIAFDVVTENCVVYDQKAEPTSDDRLNLVVNEQTHLGKIVTPWYRCDDIQYVVIDVCTGINAMSEFATADYPTYFNYFKEKYQCTILNPTLPLLLVKRISKRLNCLKPRGSKGKRKKEELLENFEEHLLPELCVKQDFPGSLWFQASLLPSILYRLNHLLKTEELRRLVAKEAGLGCEDLRPGEKWEPLIIDLSVPIENVVQETPTEKQEVEDENSSIEVVEHVDVTTALVQGFRKDIDTKLLEIQYPWKDSEEPIDIDRNLNVTLMDIQYYEIFISKKMTQTERELRNAVPTNHRLAITYDQSFVHKGIKLIEEPRGNKGPELAEMYRAVTALHCNEIVNFERLETLGDSFLKFVSSLYIILKYPKYDEGKSTSLKSKLVSNKNLYYLAKNKKLGGILQYWEFQPTAEWCPPGYSVPKVLKERIEKEELPNTSLYLFDIPPEEQVSGVLSRDTIHHLITETEEDSGKERTRTSMCHFVGCHYVPDKIVADVVEALLGGYFSACGIQGGFKFVEWLNIIPTSENICNLLNFEIPNPVLDVHCTQQAIDFHITSWRAIEKALGYHFNNRAYLLQALTHASYSANRITSCYQRLEFLGDAILDFLITCYIYESCGNLSPGELTDLRSALVNNVTFACFTVRCGFYKFMLSMNSKLEKSVDKFVEYQENKDMAINDDVIMLLNENDLHIGESVDVPKALGDIFEALAGAVFLDSGMNLKKVWEVFYKIIWKEVESFSKNVPKNAIRLLYETQGAHPYFHKQVELDNGKIMVKLDFMLNGAKKRVHGFGDNKTIARKAAAKIALRLLN